jgi:nitrogen fixation-related uncharacterized protein
METIVVAGSSLAAIILTFTFFLWARSEDQYAWLRRS